MFSFIDKKHLFFPTALKVLIDIWGHVQDVLEFYSKT